MRQLSKKGSILGALSLRQRRATEEQRTRTSPRGQERAGRRIAGQAIAPDAGIAVGLEPHHVSALVKLHRALCAAGATKLSLSDLTQTVARQPQMLSQRQETLVSNVTSSAELLGIGRNEFLAAALRRPPLFCQNPSTIRCNVQRSARLLGIESKQFVRAALKQPQLLYQKPDTLWANVKLSANQLGVTRKAFVMAAMRQPALLYQKPATLGSNATRSAALLGIARRQFVAAALKHPPLFSLKPDTLHTNVARSAAMLGISRSQFVVAALRQPPLFSLRPENLKRKQQYLSRILQALAVNKRVPIDTSSVLAGLCYAAPRLHARYVIAKLGLFTKTFSGLLVLPARQADTLIRGHFVDQMRATGRGARALQVMHASGIIETLPPGVDPLMLVRRARG